VPVPFRLVHVEGLLDNEDEGHEEEDLCVVWCGVWRMDGWDWFLDGKMDGSGWIDALCYLKG
jgi:hypothetical protein